MYYDDDEPRCEHVCSVVYVCTYSEVESSTGREVWDVKGHIVYHPITRLSLSRIVNDGGVQRIGTLGRRGQKTGMVVAELPIIVWIPLGPASGF